MSFKDISKYINSKLGFYEEDDYEDEELDIREPLAPKKEAKQPLNSKQPLGPKQPLAAKPQAPKFKPAEPLFKNKDLSSSEPKAEKAEAASSRTISMPMGGSMSQVVILKPVKFDESGVIAQHLLDNKPVIVNFEQTDELIAKRMTDFISGAVYALGGSIKKMNRNVILCAPKNIHINMGEQADEGSEQPWKR